MKDQIEALKEIDDLVLGIKIAQTLISMGQLPGAYRHMMNVAKTIPDDAPPWTQDIASKLRRSCSDIRPVVEALSEIDGAIDMAKKIRKCILEEDE